MEVLFAVALVVLGAVLDRVLPQVWDRAAGPWRRRRERKAAERSARKHAERMRQEYGNYYGRRYRLTFEGEPMDVELVRVYGMYDEAEVRRLDGEPIPHNLIVMLSELEPSETGGRLLMVRAEKIERIGDK